MSRSTADWQLHLESDAWRLLTPEGEQRHAFAGSPETVLAKFTGTGVRGKQGLRVVLGDAWLRYLILDWPAGLRRGDERRGFMLHRFRLVHDIAEPNWIFAMDRGVENYPALACAMPAWLLNAIRDFAEVRGLRLESVTSDFPVTFGRLRHRFAEPAGSLAAFALQRDTRLTVGLWRDGAWLALRSQTVAVPDVGMLAAMLEGWRLKFARPAAEGEDSQACDNILYMAGPAVPLPSAWRCVAVEAA